MTKTVSPIIPPIVTIDGPSGSGKGTVAALLAKKLGFHLLDSGALYRLVGLAAINQGLSVPLGEMPEGEARLSGIAENLDVTFVPSKQEARTLDIHLSGEDVTDELRLETTGEYASQVAAKPAVRQALLKRQRSLLQLPGLVADGRDMATVVFPDANVKIFLTASSEERAERRYKQLINKGETVTLPALLREIQARDDRDMNRAIAPLKPAEDALLVDSTELSIDEVLATILEHAATLGVSG